jgi:hypothetical protein
LDRNGKTGPSTNSRFWGIVIDLREEQKQNAHDSMRVNSDSVSNDIDESELLREEHDKQRI